MSKEITGRWPGNSNAVKLQKQLEEVNGLEIRPSTVLSSALQELKLRNRIYHGPWEDATLHHLSIKLIDEVNELKEALGDYLTSPTPENGIAVMLEVADVQNYGMMIQDNMLGNIYGTRGGAEKEK